MNQFLSWVVPETTDHTVEIIVYVILGLIILGTAIAVGVILWRGRQQRNTLKEDVIRSQQKDSSEHEDADTKNVASLSDEAEPNVSGTDVKKD